ncbi:AMP-binding protein [Salsuginibacillus halophilus]|uniref:AMP-binding protein n=1 Tax=Salsuginibacillus halophilus TaxID=517424 RepID=UPI000D0DD80E|nr:AMP-binding protein [Salsuginibacillus halophilus]
MLEYTVGELLEKTAEAYPKTEGMVYRDLGLRQTYAEFNQATDELAKSFIGLGVEKGEHVAIWAANKPEWLLSQFATAKAGAVLVTVNTNYRSAELAYVLQQSDASTLILQKSLKDVSYLEELQKILPELQTSDPGKIKSERFPHLKRVIFIDEEGEPGTFSWSEFEAKKDEVSDAKLHERKASLDADEVINMQYTSGTTGFPKGVMLTHRNIVNNASNIGDCMNLRAGDRLCIPVPFFHCFGCVLGTLACVTKGATMIPLETFDPEAVLETVEAEQCTALHGVPTMFISELNHPSFDAYHLSSLRTGIMAGSNCPEEVMKAVIEKMGAAEITIAYGQTEASPVITQTRVDDAFHRRVETVGRALPEVEVKIADRHTGEPLPPGEQGELCTRGYHVMKGYYKNEEATSAVLSEDGWLHTGDLAVMDEDGYCRITGRLKDMIIRGGENIYPREIEEFLYTHPKVLDVQVVGVPDETYGEEVSAWVQLKEGETATVDELKAYCRDHISKFKVPRYIAFVSEYPMTASGKVQKFKLREQAEEAFRNVEI